MKTPLTDAVVNKSLEESEGRYMTEDLLNHARELEQKLAQAHKDYGHELRDPNGTIWEECARLQKELKEAQRDSLRLSKLLEARRVCAPWFTVYPKDTVKDRTAIDKHYP